MTNKKIQTKNNSEKRPFRQSGDALRVRMCRVTDPEARTYLEFAARNNQHAYSADGYWCVDVYGKGQIYRAPDAHFSRLESGTYVHKGEGRFVRME